MTAMPGIRWTRVLLAGAAVHVAGVIVSVGLSTWSLPVLTLPAAVWVASGARRASAALNGLLAGLLVAGILGLLFFWPNDLRSIALFTLIIAAGFAGGLAGGEIPSRR